MALPFLAPLLAWGAANPAIAAAAVSGGARLIGGMADRRQAERNYQRNDLIKTMNDAKEAGFHPLEALRSGYTQSQIAQAPRISSMGVAANAVDAAASMYRDTMAQQKQDALIDAQIANIRADTERMGSISTYSGSMPRLASGSIDGGVPKITDGPHAGEDLERVKPQDAVALSDGSTTDGITVGFDVDEWMSGQALEYLNFLDKRFVNRNQLLMERRSGSQVHDASHPVLWPYELGDKPNGWDDMGHIERTNYLHRRNPRLFNMFAN